MKSRASASLFFALAAWLFLFNARVPAAGLPVLQASPPWPEITNIVTAELNTAKDARPPMPEQELHKFLERLRRGQDGGRKDMIAHVYENARVDGHHHLGGTVVCFFPELNLFYLYGDCAQNHLDSVAGPFQGDPRLILKPVQKKPAPPAARLTPNPNPQSRTHP